MSQIIILLFLISSMFYFPEKTVINQSPNLKDQCPRMEISCYLDKNECLQKQKTFAVSGNIGIITKPPVYKWKVRNGKIIEGQGTPIIKVEAKNPTKKMDLTVTVKNIIPKGCVKTFSVSIPALK